VDVEQILDGIYHVPNSSKALFRSIVKEVSWPKGHLLLKTGKVETTLYLIRKGIVRAYSYLDDDEITFWFGKEGDVVVSMQGYVANMKSYEDIELLEDCDLYEIRIADLQKLFLEDIYLANWGRKFVELELIKTEKRLIARQFGTAANRYKQLLETSPYLLQRVQLGYIASYLGISQVSLSRIRAELK
jgi:CRP-like cAMP-binding protein